MRSQSYQDVIGAYANRGLMTTIGGFDVLSNHVCPGTDPRLNIFANWKLPQCDDATRTGSAVPRGRIAVRRGHSRE